MLHTVKIEQLFSNVSHQVPPSKVFHLPSTKRPKLRSNKTKLGLKYTQFGTVCTVYVSFKLLKRIKSKIADDSEHHLKSTKYH